MILVISTCKEKLSESEFVDPIVQTLKNAKIKSFSRYYTAVSNSDLRKAKKIIICGTALKDFGYVKNISKFKWLRQTDKPVLGICAGMQAMALTFQGKLKDKVMIGKGNIDTKKENKLTGTEQSEAYFLSSKAAESSDFDTLATSDNTRAIIKHNTRELYGCLFHPEVLNKNIILSFCALP